jgi:hypothetical protein
MSADKLGLPNLRNVEFFHKIPKIWEIWDPAPEFMNKLNKAELVQIASVGIRFSQKMINLKMEEMKVQQEFLGEIEKTIREFR